MQASSESLDYNHLEPGAVVDVETKSRHYRIECLGGNSVRISECGHRLLFVVDRFPVTTSKVLHVHCEPKKC